MAPLTDDDPEPRSREVGGRGQSIVAATDDDRGDPVIQISPPLVAGQEQFDEIAQTLGTVLREAGERMQVAA